MKARGEKHHSAKLTSAHVKQIRARTKVYFVTPTGKRCYVESFDKLGREFGVSRVAIFKIVHRQTWAHI